MSKYVFEKFCKIVYDKLQDHNFVGESKMKKQDFSRNRKLGFADTILIVLNKTGQGVRSAIGAYLASTKQYEMEYTQQAFSKGRMRIKWEAFRELHQLSVGNFYEMFPQKKYRGYRVMAIDGTRIDLPYHAETVKEFGVQNHTGNQTQSLGSCLCDVLNGVILDGKLDRYDASERKIAEDHIRYLDTIKTDKEIILFDRGYFSSDLMDLMQQKGIYFVMRGSYSHVKTILKKCDSPDFEVEHTFFDSKLTLYLRVLQLQLSNGTTEYLVTNIFDKTFLQEDFLLLYHMRWGIESKYDDLKNKLKLEDFSGITPLAIRQDFYATLMLINMVAMLTAENADRIESVHNNNENKHQYKANINFTVSLLKREIVNMLIYAGTAKGRKIFKNIQRDLTAAVVPIRPGRSFPRLPAHKGNKFPQNMKS